LIFLDQVWVARLTGGGTLKRLDDELGEVSRVRSGGLLEAFALLGCKEADVSA